MSDSVGPLIPLGRSQLLPPDDPVTFELLCRDLFREIWRDPNTQLHGRRGQPDSGVDVFGRPNQGDQYAGVQCKKRDNFLRSKLSESEIVEEARKAKCQP